MKKKELSKDEIINTAFIEWGKSYFKDTSLAVLSKKLKITKPALYRYFKDKNQILESMKQIVVNNIVDFTLLFISESSALNDLNDVIKLFINKHFYYFSMNLNHFFFYLLYITKRDYFNQDNIKILIEKEKETFSQFTSKFEKSGKTWLKPENSFILLRFVISTGIFILIDKCFKKIELSKSGCVIFSDQEIEKLLNDIYTITKNGFSKKRFKEIDFIKIELESVVYPHELPKRDKLFDAISSVVARDGIFDTTIGKIAKELGMSKSSLYFHFLSKNEMLSDMITKEVTTQLEIIRSKLSKYNTFEEKLYSLIISFFSYYMNDTRILNVFDWLHMQANTFKNSKKFKNAKIKFFNMIFELIDLNMFDNRQYDNEFIFSFIHIQIIKEIFLSKTMNYEINTHDMRYIYQYIINGISKKEYSDE